MKTHPDVSRAETPAPSPPSELTGTIIGAFYRVYNALGYGFLEIVYVRALRVELRRLGIPHRCEVAYPVMYHGVEVGTYRADLIVAESVIVEVKSTRDITRADFRQVLNYLRTTGLHVGLLLHFGPRADFHRLVL